MKKIIFILLICSLSLFVNGCTSSTISDITGIELIYEVEYEITGTGTIDISYYNSNEEEITLENVSLPWSHSFIGKKGNKALVKYTKNTANETIITKLLINGNTREKFIDKPEDQNLIIVVLDEI
ncbi:MmpS family transport accessory protein [Orenia marismortui]|uniref:MmpS family membrane protein n=1 Tax=Orenia marismortui TaxID=46469 RepID=A0A4R8GVP4_9FIRM|nr:MmpS family transport accessory protein [Orenia marismortui]TDX46771.1 MmpS family membrane protein [Orenia marismortui]